MIHDIVTTGFLSPFTNNTTHQGFSLVRNAFFLLFLLKKVESGGWTLILNEEK